MNPDQKQMQFGQSALGHNLGGIDSPTVSRIVHL